MNRYGLLAALNPPLYAVIFYLMNAFLGLDWRGITPPAAALLRSLAGVLAFGAWDRAGFRTPAAFLLYGAYAGAVLEKSGLLGAGVGALSALLLLPFWKAAERLHRPLYRFFLALIYVFLATLVFTLALLVLGRTTGWLLPLVLLLSGFLEGYAFDLHAKRGEGQKQQVEPHDQPGR